MKKKIFTSLLITLFTALLAGCHSNPRASETGNWMQDNGKIKTLSTTSMIGDLVEGVGGEHVDNLVLISRELDPHSYQLVKGDDEKISFATILFANGLGLEHGASLHQSILAHPNSIALGEKITETMEGPVLTYDGMRDPHIWTDISLWQLAIPHVVEKLTETDPAHAEEFRANGEALSRRMAEVHEEAKEKLRKIDPKYRYLVTSHDAFNYFTKAYLATDEERENGSWQERFAAPEGLSPESRLSTADIQEIVNHLERYQVSVIFPESNVSQNSLRKVVEATRQKGMSVQISPVALYGDAMGPNGECGDTYLEMIMHNVHAMIWQMDPEQREFISPCKPGT